MNLKIGCLQMDVTYGNPEENRESIQRKINYLHKELNNVDILVLPELWDTGYDLSRLSQIGDWEGRTAQSFLSKLARQNDFSLIGGSIAKTNEQSSTNTMYAYNRNGVKIVEYSKAHLFQLMDEHHYLNSGDQKGSFEIEGVPSTGMICYDLRFPEWIRTHTSEGAEILFVVAQWPLARIDHWRSLLISRAIENQCYVIACNRVGEDPKTEFGGHSMVINPWGGVISEAGTEETFLTATIDVDEVKRIRKQIPIFQDRRPEIY
ncbi:carbon-nitrogen family hydrolase [Pontibacillus marinus]|uniref:Hydrolase n=1 Tax=Pontibacillus marinus BH030004 = DSM 16465 TaxID=1385511 RepID=A0A0A5I6H6_9BACI|nr:carbon-nitrogen family hydrolase [Pontibacillus marinus]KGX91427.1 hydrolase [Pontibacillus marinus BH030004 = DSM 16465]